MVQAIALLICHDHREKSVGASINKLSQDVSKHVRGVTVKPRRLHLLFGTRPYEVFIDLQAKDEDTLVRALDYIEGHFSHVDGFI